MIEPMLFKTFPVFYPIEIDKDEDIAKSYSNAFNNLLRKLRCIERKKDCINDIRCRKDCSSILQQCDEVCDHF